MGSLPQEVIDEIVDNLPRPAASTTATRFSGISPWDDPAFSIRLLKNFSSLRTLSSELLGYISRGEFWKGITALRPGPHVARSLGQRLLFPLSPTWKNWS